MKTAAAHHLVMRNSSSQVNIHHGEGWDGGEQSAASGRTGPIRPAISERKLPACVRDVLGDARAARPGVELTCLSFHTREDGREVTRIGEAAELFDRSHGGSPSTPLHPKDVIVLSVTTTETTCDNVRTVTHVVVARLDRRSPLRLA
jgi:hypothetical protein